MSAIEDAMDDLGQISKRPFTHWAQDGLPCLVFGLNFMLTGFVFLIEFALPRNPFYPFAAILFWCAISLASRWGLTKLKQRIVFPRSGYIAFQPSGWMRYTSVIAIGTVLAIVVPIVIYQPRFHGWTLIAGPAAAVFFALASLDSWFRYGFPDGILWAGVSLAVGVWMFHIHAGFIDGLLWLLIALGGAWVFTGGLRLYFFLRTDASGKERSNA